MTSDDTPTPPSGDTLRDHARALHDMDPTLSERLTHDADAHLELVALARAARSETDVLLAAAVQSARGAGCTWEQVGTVLGMTRQAAQQRYGQPDASTTTAAATGGGSRQRLILRPLSAFNEMSVLARAGRYGWHSVAFGPLFHIVERDDRQWEHTRTHGSVPDGGGWLPVGSGWAWWTYWARPTDAPALDGDPTAAELVRG